MKYVVSLNGKDYEVEVEKGDARLVSVNDTPAPAPVAVSPAVTQAPVAAAAPAAVPVAAAPAGSGEPLASPMPGVVLSVKAQAGQAVKSGDLVMTIEAMKMENEIFAPFDCTITSIPVKQGDTVDTGTPLAYLAK